MNRDVCEHFVPTERHCDKCENDKLRAEKERAEAERDAAVKDAERYRWLRNGEGRAGGTGHPFIAQYNGSFSCWTGEHADAAIDAARKGEQ